MQASSLRQDNRDCTTINLCGTHPFRESDYCGYCKGKRTSYNGEEIGLKNALMGMTASKMKVEDYELFLDKGFCLSGDYMRLHDQTKSCCEVFQYKVKAAEFKMNRS